jgi:hypothetical protein
VINDPTALRVAAHAFTLRLGNLNKSLEEGDTETICSVLNSCVISLSKDMGCERGITCKLAPLDLPKVSHFLERRHQYTCGFKLLGEADTELILNSNALDLGHFPQLMGRLPVLVWLFDSVLKKLPDFRGDYICVLGDASVWDAVAFSSSNKNACLVPDAHFFASAGHADDRARMAVSIPAWENRIHKVLWRGSSSGIKRYWPPKTPDDVSWLPRLEFCASAKMSKVAKHVDVGVVKLVQIPDSEVIARLSASNLMAQPIDKSCFANFKAVFDIDGNGNSWHGLFSSLLTAACVIKVQSEHGLVQWYYDRLKPWIHYVPVKSDLSDLEEIVSWVLDHDDQARKIGQAGREFANSMDFNSEMDAAVGRLITQGYGPPSQP